MKNRKPSLPVAAMFAAIFSFGIATAAYALAPPLWPGSCRACQEFGPGGTSGGQHNIAVCQGCCEDDPDCSAAGAGVVARCKDCCDNYNGGSPTGPVHCN